MIYNGFELPDPFEKKMIRKLKKKNVSGPKKKTYSMFYYYYTDEFGKRHQVSTGKNDLEESKTEIKRRFDLGILEGNGNPDVLFKDFSKPFWVWGSCPIIQDKLDRGGSFGLSTCLNNRHQMEKHLSPYFDLIPLSKITKETIQVWVKTCFKKNKLSKKTCNNLLVMLRQMLDYGVSKKLILTNPCREVKGFKVSKTHSSRDGFKLEDIRSLFKNRWNNYLSYVCCVLSSQTGLRLGEIRGLRVEDIKEDYILVKHSWNDNEGLKCPKNGHTRNVPITKEMRELLLSISPKNGGFIFSINDGKSPIEDRVITDTLKNEMGKIGLKYDGKVLSFHSFRFFYNSYLLDNNVDSELINYVVGHISSPMMERYTKLGSFSGYRETINNIVSKIGWENPYKELEDPTQLLVS